MSTDLAPFRFQHTNDISRLQNFVVATRNLTPGEQAAFDKFAYDYARLDANAREEAFVQTKAGELFKHMVSAFADTVVDVKQTIDGVTDPWSHDYVLRFAEGGIPLLMRSMGGIFLASQDRA